MQARFYAPMYGRFLSPDPARDQHFEQTQSWNIYSYVQNDPTMRVDPTGMVLQDAASAISLGITLYETYIFSNAPPVQNIHSTSSGSPSNIDMRMGLPLKDPEAQKFENGQTVRMDRLSPGMQSATKEFGENIEAEGGSLRVNSGWRPMEYQDHLLKVWNLSKDKGSLSTSDKKKVDAEKKKHSLKAKPASSRGAHPKGDAVDVSWSGVSKDKALNAANKAGLRRPYGDKDPVHFELKPQVK